MNPRNKKKIATVISVRFVGGDVGHLFSAVSEDGTRYVWGILDDELAYQINVGDTVSPPAGSKTN